MILMISLVAITVAVIGWVLWDVFRPRNSYMGTVKLDRSVIMDFLSAIYPKIENPISDTPFDFSAIHCNLNPSEFQYTEGGKLLLDRLCHVYHKNNWVNINPPNSIPAIVLGKDSIDRYNEVFGWEAEAQPSHHGKLLKWEKILPYVQYTPSSSPLEKTVDWPLIVIMNINALLETAFTGSVRLHVHMRYSKLSQYAIDKSVTRTVYFDRYICTNALYPKRLRAIKESRFNSPPDYFEALMYLCSFGLDINPVYVLRYNPSTSRYQPTVNGMNHDPEPVPDLT